MMMATTCPAYAHWIIMILQSSISYFKNENAEVQRDKQLSQSQ